MSAKDKFHENFVRALQKDGWTITHDPLAIKLGEADLFVDVGAERLITAQRDNEKIAVEIKSFIGKSPIQDLKEALGQFMLYQDALDLSAQHQTRRLFLAVRQAVFATLFDTDAGKLILANHRLRLIVFDPVEEVIIQWV